MEGPFVKYVLLLPLCYNDGRKVPSRTLSGMTDKLFVLAGGFTIAGTVQGAYQMEDGTRQEDECLQVWIGVREEQVRDLKELVAKFGRTLGQEKMYLERTGGSIEFIRPFERSGEGT